MSNPLVTVFAALGGPAIGGLTTLAVTWLAQRTQLRASLGAHEQGAREELYRQFIEESSKLLGDALINDTVEIPMLVGAYAIINRMRVVSSTATVEKAETVMRTILDLYAAPNRTFAEVRADVKEHKLDILRDFSGSARNELLTSHY